MTGLATFSNTGTDSRLMDSNLSEESGNDAIFNLSCSSRDPAGDY